MENVRTTFQEAQSSTTLNPDEQVSLSLIYTSINNLVNRLKNSSFPLPPIEAVVEVLLTACPDAESQINGKTMVLVNEVTTYFTGNTMSYV